MIWERFRSKQRVWNRRFSCGMISRYQTSGKPRTAKMPVPNQYARCFPHRSAGHCGGDYKCRSCRNAHCAVSVSSLHPPSCLKISPVRGRAAKLPNLSDFASGNTQYELTQASTLAGQGVSPLTRWGLPPSTRQGASPLTRWGCRPQPAKALRP